MKDNESKFKDIVIMFAIIGVLATITFVSDLFDNEDTDNICGAYLGKNDELESEMTGLKDEIEALKNRNYELEAELETTVEERNAYMEYYEEKEGIEYPKLTDGAKK